MSGSGKENIMTNHLKLADSYLRLSDEEKKYGNESESITNQREIIRDYCKKQGIIIVSEFVDDGYSGGNFERPGFQAMLNHLAAGKANTVITKDLSRLGLSLIHIFRLDFGLSGRHVPPRRPHHPR